MIRTESKYTMFDNGDVRLRPNFYALKNMTPTFDTSTRIPSRLSIAELDMVVRFYTWICHQTGTHPPEHMIGVVNAWLKKDSVAISLGRWTEGPDTSVLLSLEVLGGPNPRIYQTTNDGVLMVHRLPDKANLDRTYRNDGMDILFDEFKHNLSHAQPR